MDTSEEFVDGQTVTIDEEAETSHVEWVVILVTEAPHSLLHSWFYVAGAVYYTLLIVMHVFSLHQW